MNILLRTACILAFVSLWGLNQNVHAQNYHYRFTIAGVTDLGAAKYVTDPIRVCFNTNDHPFSVYPSFNDDTDTFDFYAETPVQKAELEEMLAKQGIVLQSFVKSIESEGKEITIEQ